MNSIEFRNKVESICKGIQDLLISKNESYGNSALEPLNVFSDLDNVEGIKLRIDDKLNRIAKGHEFNTEDTITDLIGYLVLLKIAEDQKNEKESL